MKKLKALMFILIAIIVVVIFLMKSALMIKINEFVIGGFMIGGLFNPPISQEKVEKIFLTDYEYVFELVEYMKSSKYDNIIINLNDYIHNYEDYGTWFVYDEDGQHIHDEEEQGVQKIADENIVEILDILFKQKKYQIITKDDDTISFQLWSNLDKGIGFAYTLNGDIPEIQFLTKFEKLKKENWYYYEDDFNEWRLQNK